MEELKDFIQEEITDLENQIDDFKSTITNPNLMNASVLNANIDIASAMGEIRALKRVLRHIEFFE